MILIVNGEQIEVNSDPEMPLLWFLRDNLGLTGSKYGCGIGLCGSCVVLIDGKAVQSCLLKIGQVGNKSITTIEGLSDNNSHPIQNAWEKLQVPQCGYCQSGQILTAVSLLDKNPEPGDEEINDAMSSVLCRCGTYPRIKKAIKLAIKMK